MITTTGKQCAASVSQSVTPYGTQRSVGTEINILLADDDRANSLALNVQITYLRRFLSPDSSIEIISLKKRGYYLKIM